MTQSSEVQAAVENVHRVPSKQWGKWSGHQRLLFNRVRSELLMMGPQIVCHPRDQDMTKGRFDTIAWNSAWTAADQLGEL